MTPLHIVILAAGQGTRMFSDTPKVLHPLAGKPMLLHVIETALTLRPEAIHVIIGHGGERIKEELSHLPVHFVTQSEQLGTGHALAQALPFIKDNADVLVLSGDVPLIKEQTLRHLINIQPTEGGLSLLVATVKEPKGLGRIVRNTTGDIQAIIEEKDASVEVRNIHEIYTGICMVSARYLKRWLPALKSNNAQGEYYLTSITHFAIEEGLCIHAASTLTEYEILGVNNRLQLQTLERIYQSELAQALMLQGVTIMDASRIDIRGTLRCGKDVYIDINAIFIGDVNLADGVVIGPHCILNNVSVGQNSHIFAHSIIEQSEIAADCHIGPFARLRPGTLLASSCKIGNFVETKNASFDAHSKANHLSYLGDVTIGKHVNIGAGTITCNYDGANKYQTIIEDGVFVGSDTQLVAPVRIGAYATIGAGSTIRKDVPQGELTLTESKTKTVAGWTRPKKSKRS